MAALPRLRPKARWYALALCAGLGAALAAGLWAVQPAWSAGHSLAGTDLLGFSADGRKVAVVEGLAANGGRPSPRVAWRDAASGRLLGVTPLACEGPAPPGCLAAAPVPGAERLLLASAPWGARPALEYHVYDAATGRRSAGPFRSETFVRLCSPDGRWCCAERDGGGGLEVVSLVTAESVLSLPASEEAVFHSAAFAPDGGRVAVCWSEPGGADRHFVRVYDLPSGRAGARLDLPERRWGAIYWAADGRLYAASVGAGRVRAVSSFALTEVGLGPERAEAGTGRYMQVGPGWAAHVDFVEVGEPRWRQALRWAAARLGRTVGPAPGGLNVRVTIADPATGKVRSELPEMPYPWAVAPDGRRVASLGPDGRLEMWSADRFPPWLWSLAAGVLCGGLVLGAGVAAGRREAPSSRSVP